MSREKKFTNKNRIRIYNAILDHPGLYLMEIKKRLGIPKTTLKYHIRFLEKHGLIIKTKNKGNTRYFGTNKIANGDKKLLNLFRQEVPRRIIFTIYVKGACTEMDIVRELDKDQSTISYHLKKLIEEEIIIFVPNDDGKVYWREDRYYNRFRISNEKFFKLKNAKEINNFLMKYQTILDDKEIIFYILYLTKLIIKYEKSYYKVKSQRDRVDRAFNIIYDVFPNPYHV